MDLADVGWLRVTCSCDASHDETLDEATQLAGMVSSVGWNTPCAVCTSQGLHCSLKYCSGLRTLLLPCAALELLL